MDVEELIARAEIVEVITRYYRSMDRVDDELGISIFHEDGTGDYGPGIFSGSGRDLIIWLNEYNRTLITSHHQMSNTTINVNGDHAASESYVEANLVRAEGDGFIVRHVHGRYLDRLSKRNGRWAIDHRFYRRDFFWEERQDEITIGESSARTRDDASYELFTQLARPA